MKKDCSISHWLYKLLIFSKPDLKANNLQTVRLIDQFVKKQLIKLCFEFFTNLK